MSLALLLLLAVAAPQAPATPVPPTAKTDDKDKLICKRFTETGSLVRGYRTCKTRADWQRARDDARASMSTGNGCGEFTGRKGC